MSNNPLDFDFAQLTKRKARGPKKSKGEWIPILAVACCVFVVLIVVVIASTNNQVGKQPTQSVAKQQPTQSVAKQQPTQSVAKEQPKQEQPKQEQPRSKLSFSLPEEYADVKIERFGLGAVMEMVQTFPDRESEVGSNLPGERMAPEIAKTIQAAEPDMLDDFAGLEKAGQFLEKYPRPWTLPKVIAWYCSSADDKERICFLKVLAQVSDVRATYVVGEALEWDSSLVVRLAACELITTFCEPSSSQSNVEMVKAATTWWTANKDRLRKELNEGKG